MFTLRKNFWVPKRQKKINTEPTRSFYTIRRRRPIILFQIKKIKNTVRIKQHKKEKNISPLELAKSKVTCIAQFHLYHLPSHPRPIGSASNPTTSPACIISPVGKTCPAAVPPFPELPELPARPPVPPLVPALLPPLVPALPELPPLPLPLEDMDEG